MAISPRRLEEEKKCAERIRQAALSEDLNV